MTSTSAMSTGHQAFVDKLNGVLGANFSTHVPSATKRSGGLDPQCGLVIGLGADNKMTGRLAADTEHLPGVWSQYTEQTLHLTLGACEDRSVADITVPLTDGRTMEQRYERLLEATVHAHGAGAFLGNPRVLFSGDTIILTGEPSVGLYEVREMLTGAEAAQMAGVRRGWGAHLTLARATRPLTEDERIATNTWARDLSLAPVVELTNVVAGAFSVVNDQFRFVRSSVTKLKEV